VFNKAVYKQDVTNPVSLSSFYRMYDSLSSLILCKSAPFYTSGPTDLLHPSAAPHFKAFKVFLVSHLQKMQVHHLRSNFNFETADIYV